LTSHNQLPFEALETTCWLIFQVPPFSDGLHVLKRRWAITPYLYVPLLVVVALLQVTVAPHLTLLGARSDLMLLTVVSWSLLRGPREGIMWGFVGGLCLDLFSGGPFGLSALTLMAIGFFSGLGEMNVYRSRIALPIIAALTATLIHGFLYLSLSYIMGRSAAWLDTLLQVMLPSTLFNSLLVVPIYAIFRWLHRKTSREELRW